MKERQVCKIFTDQNITSYSTSEYKLHRIGGPALIENSVEKYYVENKEYSKILYYIFSMLYKLRWMILYSCKYSFYKVTIYFKNGEWHSENDQPCYIMSDFKIDYDYTPMSLEAMSLKESSVTLSKYRWCKDGKTHRETGPALIYTNGEERWFLNGILYKNPEEMPNSLYITYCKYQFNKGNRK